MNYRNIAYFVAFFVLIVLVGIGQSWSVALQIMALCLISAVMALGVNIQWGYAGLFSVGTVGFVAIGGVAAVITSMPPVKEAWAAGGLGTMSAMLIATATIIAAMQVWKRMASGRMRTLAMTVLLFGGLVLYRTVFDPAVTAIENVNPASTGYLGGLGLPVLFSWVIAGILAAGVAWLIGKVSLGLKSDYLAIATLGIGEIIIAVIKNEDWLTRGVKNVNGIPRPTAYEVNLQADPTFMSWVHWLGLNGVDASSYYVKFSYIILFSIVLFIILWMSEKALNSPWGRMMRAIRDDEEAAEAMGKDVTRRRLQAFVIGSAVTGIAGAMLVSMTGLLSPDAYQPLRFTFLIWVMVIVGGSGNNWGSVLGGFLIWFLWIEVEPMGRFAIGLITSGMADGYWLKTELLNSAAYTRLLTMGIILLVMLRFAPRGLIPEK